VPPMTAHWRHLANTFELVYPSAHSRQSKRQIDRLSCFAQLTAESAYNSQWVPLSIKTGPSNVGIWTPVQHMMLWAHASPQPKQHLDRFSRVFTDDHGVCLYFTMVCLFCPLKIAPYHLGIWTSCNTWFIGPTRVLNPNGNLIVSAVFARLTSVTD